MHIEYLQIPLKLIFPIKIALVVGYLVECPDLILLVSPDQNFPATEKFPKYRQIWCHFAPLYLNQKCSKGPVIEMVQCTLIVFANTS